MRTCPWYPRITYPSTLDKVSRSAWTWTRYCTADETAIRARDWLRYLGELESPQSIVLMRGCIWPLRTSSCDSGESVETMGSGLCVGRRHGWRTSWRATRLPPDLPNSDSRYRFIEFRLVRTGTIQVNWALLSVTRIPGWHFRPGHKGPQLIYCVS